MALTILLLLLFTVLLFACGWRNKYLILFALLVACMLLAMFPLTVEVSKISNYLVPANYLIRPLETHLYAFCRSMLHVSMSAITLIRNAGIVLYFAGIVWFVLSFSSSIRLDEERRVSRFKPLAYIPLIGFPILYFLFYHPQTAFRFFRAYHTASSPEKIQRLAGLLRTLDSFMTVCVLLYLIWPAAYLLINYRKRRMTFLSSYLLRLSIALLVLNLAFFMLFFTGIFRMSCQDVLQYGFWRFTMPTHMPVYYTTLLPAVMFIVLFTVFIILIRLHADYLLSFFKFRGIRKNLNALYANVRNVMHSEKNLLFTIRILAEDALRSPDEQQRNEKLRKITALCSSNMDDLTHTLNNAHEMNVSAMRSDFIQAVEEAIGSLQIPEGIRLERFYSKDSLPLFFDRYHMTHAVINILSNSLDALAAASPEQPQIRLNLYTSQKWVYFSVWDNGCGIPQKILHKVEQPYVSTKNKKNSWGIGLSYVYSVIRAHYGQMHIRSRQNEYTLVEILLPYSQKRR